MYVEDLYNCGGKMTELQPSSAKKRESERKKDEKEKNLEKEIKDN